MTLGLGLSSHQAKVWASLRWRRMDDSDTEEGLQVRFERATQAYGSNRLTHNAMRAMIVGRDEQCYLGVRRLCVEAVRRTRRVSVRAGIDWRVSTAVTTRARHFLYGGFARANAPIDPLHEAGLAMEVRGRAVAGVPSLTLRASGRLARSLSAERFDYSRLDVRSCVALPVPMLRTIQLSAWTVVTGGRPPVQQLADLGGIATVRGVSPRARVGTEAVALRVAWPIPIDVLRAARVPVLGDLAVRWTPWWDWGRTWGGIDAGALSSVGVSIDPLARLARAMDEVLRIDVIRVIRGPRSGSWSVAVHFDG